jgi:pilus assembly protein Flp/PilA
MFELIRLVSALRQDRRGVTALEYGLVAGAIALGIITAITALGSAISNLFNTIGGKI